MKASLVLLALVAGTAAAESELSKSIASDYKATLAPLYAHLHANPELSYMEVQTAARMARELRAAGYEVTEHVGKTGIVAILRNGKGPLVMMRADMDGLPVEERSGSPFASKVRMKDMNGVLQPVMHACGHDVHMTSLVGTAHQMAARRKDWSGTLMLIGQPAEERIGGAYDMMNDRLWERFGKPDYALGLHVVSEIPAGKIEVTESMYSGADMLDLIVHGEGAHGASPHQGKDPIVLASQIVLALQTIVTREIAPREGAIITVGAFHAGSKGNIIGDSAKLEMTIRYDNPETRSKLLAAIERVAKNTARAAGLPENRLPELKLDGVPTPPTINNIALMQRLERAWMDKMGADIMDRDYRRGGMGAEDYALFVANPAIPSVYFRIGATPPARLAAVKAGKETMGHNHSPLFQVAEEPAIRTGVEATTVALMELMKR